MERTELISLLGVANDPTTGQVRQARRSLARRVHPDAAGLESEPMMSEINAAVDEWLAQIRSHCDTTTTTAAQAPTPGPARPTHIDAPVPLSIVYAIATILLFVVSTVLVVALVGFSVMSLVTSTLLSSGAAGIFATLVHRHERQATRRS